ncbi:hypothetical protein [Saccharomonospora iraqiensis]|uniref:hypothetical protein n=1 Tax=Saccharomonospora iraqiensis TaxID=52698 RepID=UPI0003FFEF96|nr:hypothetical protein [Saccharomonospora iraqiensis]
MDRTAVIRSKNIALSVNPALLSFNAHFFGFSLALGEWYHAGLSGLLLVGPILGIIDAVRTHPAQGLGPGHLRVRSERSAGKS